MASDTEKIAALENTLSVLRKQYDDALDALEYMVAQHCACGDEVDSMAYSANAQAMDHLASEGRLVLDGPPVGRRVIAHWPKRETEVPE